MNGNFYDMPNFNNYRRRTVPKRFPFVEIKHWRVENHRLGTDPKGGMTIVRYWLEENCVVSGVAFCCDKDTYNKRKGKSIAFGRLMRSFYKSGAKASYLKKLQKRIRIEIGTISDFYFNEAYNGDEIQ
jgi:uncharacterized protein YecE (DUF72 family)